MRLTKKHARWIIFAVIVVFVLASAGVAYLAPWQDPVSKVFKQIYPAAIVGGTLVSIAQADDFVTAAQNLDNTVSARAAFQTFIQRQKSEVLLGQLGLKLNSDSVSDELTFYTKGNEEQLNQMLQKYFGGNQGLFVETVVQPEAVAAKLAIYYNSDKSLNLGAWNKANTILSQIENGQKFEDLAKADSDDKQSAQFGGDLGFFAHGQVIPELEKEIAIAKIGEVDKNIIVTRDGYEIIYPIEISDQSAGKEWHAKHILVQTTGFNQWLVAQTQNISVKTLKAY